MSGWDGMMYAVPAPEAGMSLGEYLLMLLMAGLVTYGRQALEVAYKSIPDDETGWKGALRDVLQALAGYRKNVEHKEEKHVDDE